MPSRPSDHIPEASVNQDDGLFLPESIIRKVSQESVSLLAGGRALLMQLAHPLIAISVAQHSSFQAEPLRRLERTLDLMQALVLGSRQQAQTALAQFQTTHAPIVGRLAHRAGRFPAGQRYSAQDPTLRLWVYASLIDSQLCLYEQFVAPLSAAQQQQFWADSYRLGEALGIPSTMLPATPAAFEEYMATMLAGDTLVITPQAQALSQFLLKPPVSLVPAACAWLVRLVTPGLLPSRLRVAYGLDWTARQQVALDSLAWISRHSLPFLPAWLRYIPPTGRQGFIWWAIQGDQS